MLKGVVRAERIPDPENYIQAIIDRTERKHLVDCFGINDWTDHEDFIEQVAKNTGKLIKGGEADYNNVCKQIITDWQRGRIPFYTKPPEMPGFEKKDEAP